MRKFPDISIGDKFNHWTVIANSDKRAVNRGKYFWCQCSCDNKTTREVLAFLLKNGGSISCGCFKNNITRSEALKSNFKLNFLRFKTTAIKRKIPHSISIGEFSLLSQLNCAYSDLPPNRKMAILGEGSEFTKSQTIQIHGLDRIDSNLGYHLGNIAACDIDVNVGKLDLTYSNFYKWINNIQLCNKPILISDLTETINYLQSIKLKEEFPLTFKACKTNKHYTNYIDLKIKDFKKNRKRVNINIQLTDSEILALKISSCILCNKTPDISVLKQKIQCNDNKSLDNLLQHIDRWDSSIKDYTQSNCVSLCKNCNYFKGLNTVEILNEKITALKNNLPNLPKTEQEFFQLHSKENTIKSLIKQVEDGKIIDYFDEIPKLKMKLNDQHLLSSASK